MSLFGEYSEQAQNQLFLEILAVASDGKVLYDTYRALVLAYLDPSMDAKALGLDMEEAFGLESQEAIHKSLAEVLTLLLQTAGKELMIPTDRDIPQAQCRLLADYCQYIWDTSLSLSEDLFDTEPQLCDLQNPLADVALVQRLWEWPAKPASTMPSTEDLVRFEAPN